MSNFWNRVISTVLFHIPYECERVKYLWSDLVQYLKNTLILPTLTLQTAIFDYVRIKSFFENNKILMNQIVLIFML